MEKMLTHERLRKELTMNIDGQLKVSILGILRCHEKMGKTPNETLDEIGKSFDFDDKMLEG